MRIFDAGGPWFVARQFTVTVADRGLHYDEAQAEELRLEARRAA